MAHVFISYSSKHRELTEQLAAFLQGCGLDVWWDRELAAREPFAPQIREELRNAGSVVVLWTPGALTSQWVKDEADYAYDNGTAKNKLVSVTAEGVDWSSLPPPYNDFEHHRPFETDLILRDVLAVREGRLLLEDKREELPVPGARTPTMLLQAKFGLVPFTGGTHARNDVIDWALGRGRYAAGPRRAAGRLIHGPGGLGKTRLLIEVAEALRAEGWSAGFLARPGVGDKPEDTADMRSVRRERYAKALGCLIRGATDSGLLLTMDYAEGRNDEIRRLAQQIQARPADDARPIRLVLLTRGAGDWWTRLIEDDQVAHALFGGERLDVHALEGIVTPEDRLAVFSAAVDAFAAPLVEMNYAMPIESHGSPESWGATRALAKRLQVVETNAGYDPGEGFDRPLAIAMEALLYLAAMAPGANEPGVHSLLANILGLERDHWPKLVGPLVRVDDRDPGREMERAVAQVTGVQGVESRRTAEDLFMTDGRYPSRRHDRGKVDVLTTNVATVYGRGDFIGPFEPDLIGEHHVGKTADSDLLDGCLKWIGDAPADRREQLRRDFLTVLQRASRPEHGVVGVESASRLLDHLILEHGATLAAVMVAVIRDTPGALLDRLQLVLPALDEDALVALDDALPEHSLALMNFSIAVARRRVELARVTLASSSMALKVGEATDIDLTTQLRLDLMMYLASLAGRLGSIRCDSEALTAAQEAVDIARTLKAEQPGAYSGVLPGALYLLSMCLDRVGRRDDARAVAQEAMAVPTKQGEVEPHANHTELGDWVRNLSFDADWLSGPARDEEAAALLDALPSIQREVDSHRILASEDPQAFRPILASHLNNLGDTLLRLGRYEGATIAAREAVDISRTLAIEDPDAFQDNLARQLVLLTMALGFAGQRTEAAEVSREALAAFLECLERQPLAFYAKTAEIAGRLHRAVSGFANREPDKVLLQRMERYGGLIGNDPEV